MLEKEIQQLKDELKVEKDKVSQYEVAYREQVKRYNRLFNLLANNIDFIVSGTGEQQQ